MKKIILLFIFINAISDGYSQTSKDHVNKAENYLEVDDYDNAIIEYTKAININVSNAYEGRAYAKQKTNNFRGALEDYNKMLKLEPNSTFSLTNRCFVKCQLEDYYGGVIDATKAIDIDPNFGKAYYHRGYAKLKLGDSRGAMSDYNKCIELEPKYADAYFARGLIKMMNNNKNGGCSDFSKAGELGLRKAYELIQNFCN